MNALTSTLLLALITCLAAGPARAQPRTEADAGIDEVGLPFLENIAPETYQAHDQNWAVAQDHRGVLYFGNTVGLVEYDGASWRFIRLADGRLDLVRSLATGPDGTVYVGARGDFGYLAPDSLGQMRFVSLRPDATFSDDILRVHATPGGVFFQSASTLIRYHEGRLQRWTPGPSGTPDHHQFIASFVLGRSVYVQHTGHGLMRLEGGRLRPVSGTAVFTEAAIRAALALPGRRVLIGTQEKGFFHFDGRSVRPFPTGADAFVRTNILSDTALLPDGTVALATLRGGVAVIDTAGVLRLRIDEARGLRTQNVKALFVDAQHGLWMALNSGLARVEWPAPITSFGSATGLRDAVLSVVRHQGTLYAGTDRGLYRLVTPAGAGALPHFVEVPGIALQCWALVTTGDALLAATTGGVYEVRDGTVRLVQKGVALALHRSEHDPDRLYAGLSDGVVVLRRERGRWGGGTRVAGTDGHVVRSMVEDEAGVLWLGGAFEGVLRLPPWPDTVVHLGAKHGLAESNVRLFRLGAEAYVAAPGGIYRYHPPAAGSDTLHFRPDDALQSAVEGRLAWLLATQADARGHVWLSTWTGVGQARRRPGGTFAWTSAPFFRIADHRVHVIYPDADGTVWLGSSKGLLRVRPPFDRPAVVRHPALLRRVVARRDSVLFGGTQPSAAPVSLVVPYRDNTLRFEAAAPGFGDMRATEYQFRLEGFDDDWWPWSPDVYKQYTNLPPGRYRLHVRARDGLQRLAPESVVSVQVLPPWWRTGWALLAYGLLASGFVLILVRGRTAYLSRKTRRLEQLIEERTETVRLQKAQLEKANAALAATNEQLQALVDLKSEFLHIAAHDLKNPLSGILGFSHILREAFDETDDLDAFRREGAEIAGLIHTSTQRMVHLVHDLLEHNASDDAALTARRSPTDLRALARSVVDANRVQARAKGLTLYVENGRACEARVDDRRVAEALDNLVSNAIKYAPPGTTVRVSVYPGDTPGTVCIAVQDEGPGLTEADRARLFVPFERLSARPTAGESSHGLGLYIVKKITEGHGGSVTVDSPGAGGGSTFTLKLPAG